MRPKRYPKDAHLSSIVDQLQAIEEELAAAGDAPNAERMAGARNLVVIVATGEKH